MEDSGQGSGHRQRHEQRAEGLTLFDGSDNESAQNSDTDERSDARDTEEERGSQFHPPRLHFREEVPDGSRPGHPFGPDDVGVGCVGMDPTICCWSF